MTKKILIAIAVILVGLWSLGEILLLSDSQKIERENLSQKEEIIVATNTEKFVRDKSPIIPLAVKIPTTTQTTQTSSRNDTPTSASSPVLSQTSSVEHIATSLLIDGKTFAHRLTKGSSIATLLKEASGKGEITYRIKNYSRLGDLVISINGKENNFERNNMYWIYSVNGKKATIGVSQYVLNDGDSVSWSYEAGTY